MRPASRVGRTTIGPDEAVRAARAWWDADADAYQAAHAGDLGDAEFVWGPEGLTERDAGLLGDVAGARVLEIGCGAAQCGRWLVRKGAQVLGLDLSAAMLRHARRLDAATAVDVPVVQADARRLPVRTGSVDVACTAYGALPFLADAHAVHGEVHRVLRPDGRWVFSLSHPIRWCFPDDPGPDGLRVTTSYFDRTPYVERDGAGRVVYSEHHRTIGDHVREVVRAGFRLVDLVEPEWPPERRTVWGGWSPLRGRVLPGTLIVSCRRD